MEPITKNEYRAKLCHISVSNAARDHGLGSALGYLALRDMITRGAREVRVTTGEETFRNHAHFFRALSFQEIDWKVHRYRRGVSEIIWRLQVDHNSPCIRKIISPPIRHRIEVFGAPTRIIPVINVE